jgi:hypothetical protein
LNAMGYVDCGKHQRIGIEEMRVRNLHDQTFGGLFRGRVHFFTVSEKALKHSKG